MKIKTFSQDDAEQFISSKYLSIPGAVFTPEGVEEYKNLMAADFEALSEDVKVQFTGETIEQKVAQYLAFQEEGSEADKDKKITETQDKKTTVVPAKPAYSEESIIALKSALSAKDNDLKNMSRSLKITKLIADMPDPAVFLKDKTGLFSTKTKDKLKSLIEVDSETKISPLDQKDANNMKVYETLMANIDKEQAVNIKAGYQKRIGAQVEIPKSGKNASVEQKNLTNDKFKNFMTFETIGIIPNDQGSLIGAVLMTTKKTVKVNNIEQEVRGTTVRFKNPSKVEYEVSSKTTGKTMKKVVKAAVQLTLQKVVKTDIIDEATGKPTGEKKSEIVKYTYRPSIEVSDYPVYKRAEAFKDFPAVSQPDVVTLDMDDTAFNKLQEAKVLEICGVLKSNDKAKIEQLTQADPALKETIEKIRAIEGSKERAAKEAVANI